MSTVRVVRASCVSALALIGLGLAAGAAENAQPAAAGEVSPVVAKEYDLGMARSLEPHYYVLETRMVSYAEDGTRTLGQIHRLHLECTPGGDGDGERYTCRKFTVQTGEASPVRIPALDGWSYVFKPSASGMDEKGQVFGIDHGKFQGLTDANGTVLSPEIAYAVYNSFIDFHGFCNAFGDPVPGGKGIQDLKAIGQKMVHAAANTEPPVNLGAQIAEGSKFKNGEATLEFKGLSAVDGAPCALVGFDSGDSSFVMFMKPMPNMDIKVVGSSHYFGDLYKDLASGWIRKVAMGELVVAKVTMGEQKLANTVIERSSTIRNVSKEEFEKGLDG